MKTIAHASQNKFDGIHLVFNSGIFNIYKKEKKVDEMGWYHPAVLSFDNYADLSSFVLLTEYIQYFNTYNTHLIAKGDLKKIVLPRWKNLKDVYKSAHVIENVMMPHSDIVILSHPHYPTKSSFSYIPGKQISENKEFVPMWAQDEEMNLDETDQ